MIVPLFFTFIDDAQRWCLRYIVSLAYLRRESGTPRWKRT
jgi:hypothetical protein